MRIALIEDTYSCAVEIQEQLKRFSQETGAEIICEYFSGGAAFLTHPVSCLLYTSACGYHASDPVVMLESIARTKEAGIKIGAHPGLPDLMGFGRRNMAISPAEAKAYTLYQICLLYTSRCV